MFFCVWTSFSLLYVEVWFIVTECICTLCLCYCTLYFTLSMFFHAWTSFTHLRMFYVLLFWMSLKDMVKAQRKAEVIPTASRRYHQKSKQEYMAVAHLLLPTSNLLLPSTVYIIISESFVPGTPSARRPCLHYYQ